jgi:hypothetical protein
MAQVERRRGLIEQHDPRVLREHPRQTYPGALTARQRGVGAIGEVRHVGTRHRRRDPLLIGIRPLRAGPRRAPHLHHLAGRERERDVLSLQRHGSCGPATGAPRGERPPVEQGRCRRCRGILVSTLSSVDSPAPFGPTSASTRP